MTTMLMGATCRAIGSVVLGAVMSVAIILAAYCLLGGDKNAMWLITLVFLGIAADELKDIAGSTQTRNYQSYRDEFLARLPRFWFRIAAWSLLAAAGMVLVGIFNSGDTDAEDPGQPAAAVAVIATPWSTVAHPPAAANVGLMEITDHAPAVNGGASATACPGTHSSLN